MYDCAAIKCHVYDCATIKCHAVEHEAIKVIHRESKDKMNVIYDG